MFRLITLRFFETYLRHRFLWLLPIAGMLIYGVANFVLTKPTYVSLAALFINQETLLSNITSLNQGGYSWVTPAQATTNQINELIKTDSFVRSVIQKSDLEKQISENPAKTGKLLVSTRSSLWVNTLGDNTIVIGASNGNPTITQQLATGTVEVFLLWKINTGHNATTTALTFYEDLVRTYSAEVNSAKDELQKYLDAHPIPISGDRPPSETVEIDRLQSQLSTATGRYVKAQDELENSRLTEKINESEVRQKYLIVDSPSYPNKPALSTTKKITNSAVFILVGVVLSLLAVVVGSLLDRTFRFPEDVHFQLELPVFAIFPDWNIPVVIKKSKKKDKKNRKSEEVEVVPEEKENIAIEEG